jgi:hypothetical protein
VTVLFDAPNGTNINDGCGSTHPDDWRRRWPRPASDRLAFDGDMDRLIAVDERGELVDGDAVMGICALERLAEGTLRNSVLVATVMSNGDLERAVKAAGGTMIRTPVGTARLRAMEREDAVLGGDSRPSSRPIHDGRRPAHRHRARPRRRAASAALRARRSHSEVAAGGDNSRVRRLEDAGRRVRGRRRAPRF